MLTVFWLCCPLKREGGGKEEGKGGFTFLKRIPRVTLPAVGDGAGAVAAPYLLADYDSDSFQKNAGTLRVSGVRAGASQGRLQTSFTLLMDKPVAELTKAPMTIIYASGPIDDSGKLLPHRGRVRLALTLCRPIYCLTSSRKLKPLPVLAPCGRDCRLSRMAL